MRSHLLAGKVSHRRSRPTTYDLEHDVFYFALDMDEIDKVGTRLPLVRRNRFALFTFRDSDHMPEPADDLPSEIRAHLRSNGIEVEDGRITLITNLRVLGYVFNPASFYLCHVARQLVAVVVEVHNTHGERHLYTLRPQREDGAFTSEMNRDFYVSPFIGPDGRYRVTVRDYGDRLNIGINGSEDGRPLIATSLTLRRLPLTNRSLIRAFLRYPLVTHKTIALIHWHALRLWLRRVPFRRHSTAPLAAHGAHR